MAKRHKVLVVGLDGATFSLIKPWVKKGQLPLFQKLIKEGCYGKLKSTIPPLTPPAWVSAFTGVNPGKHGIFDFFIWEGYQRSPVFSTDIKKPMVWEILGKRNLKSFVINVPITYPPKKIKGTMITGMQTPDLKSEFTYPKSLRKRLIKDDYVIDYGDKGEVVSEKNIYLDKTINVITKRETAALRLMRKKSWDLGIVVFTTTDRVQHFFWQEKEKILKIYQRIETAIERFLKEAGQGTSLIVFSDHGFAPLKNDVYLNNYLKKAGFLSTRSSQSFLAKMGLTEAAAIDLANFLTKIGLGKVVDQLSKSVGGRIAEATGAGNIDWSKTKAWFASFAGQSVRLNLVGREPQGIVKRADYEKIREQIIKKLVLLKDPRTGKKIVKRVYKREEVYDGPYIKNAPDLILEAVKGYVFQEGFNQSLISSARQGRARRTADHRGEGIFLCRAAGVKKGKEVRGLKIWEVAPTIFHLLGMEVPVDFDSQVPAAIFTKKPRPSLPAIEKKVKQAKEVLKKTFQQYPHQRIVLAWTGGKDSTLILWLLREVCQENNFPLPRAMFINEGEVFKETIAFVKKWAKKWGVKVDFVQNDDVLKQVKKVGDPVEVGRLNQRNKLALKRLGFQGKSFPFEPESLVGNHLMKTVAMNIYLEKRKIKALITGIRWDEQEARANETYFSPRKKPPHTRVHPILHFREGDVWEATHRFKIPYVELYKEGYRSLGAKGTTIKPAEVPAWEQDLEKTTERIGRRQDKEKIMERLRKLGYM